jgi:hypothetical protein
MALVCTGFGLEWQGMMFDRQPQTHQHLIEHMIGQITQFVRQNLQGDVTVTEVITGFGEQELVAAFDHRQLFWRGINADFEAVAVGEDCAVSQGLAPG